MSGFAMSKIDEEEAALALASLQLMGQAYDDELEAFWSSKNCKSNEQEVVAEMGVVIGVIVGYALGSRAGPKAWPELEEAWKTIFTSEEVRDLVAGGLSMARDLLETPG